MRWVALLLGLVLLAAPVQADLVDRVQDRCVKAARWLVEHQRPDGGWLYEGTNRSSSMDTGVVLLGLSEFYDRAPQDLRPRIREAVDRGVSYILKCWDPNRRMFWDYPGQTSHEDWVGMYTVHALMGLIAVERRFPDVARKHGVDRYVSEALERLMSLQGDDGSWRGFGPGSWQDPYRCTPIVVWLAEWSGKYGPDDPHVKKGLRWIEGVLTKSPLGGLISQGVKIDFTAWDLLAFYYSGDRYYRGFVPKLQQGLLGFQRRDGAFAAHASVNDPVYGPNGTAAPCPHKTARVLFALMKTGMDPLDDRVKRAVEFLLNTKSQDPDGSWFWPTMDDPSKPQEAACRAYSTGWCLAALAAWLERVPSGSSSGRPSGGGERGGRHGLPVIPVVPPLPRRRSG